MKRLAARAAVLAAGCLAGLSLLGGPAPAGATETAPPTLPVTGASLIAADGQPLWSEAGDGQRAIASTTKLMTFLVVLQHLKDLHTVLDQNEWRPQAADSQIGLEPGEGMTALNLLYAMMLPSADDAAEDLAYNVGGGSVARFIGWMNAEARALGLHHTHYTTPIGLDTTGNYSSPNDLVALGAYLVGHSAIFRRIVDTYRKTVWNSDHTVAYHLVNTDDLIAQYGWIDGIKTGHTADAGYVLVSEGRRDGLTLIASVLGTDSEYERDQSALTLLNWGFDNFASVTPVRAHEVFSRARVPYELLPAVVVAAHGYSAVIAKGSRVKVSVGRLQSLTPPLAAGAVVGRLVVSISGRAPVHIPLVLERALPRVAESKKIVHLLLRPITLLLLAVLIGASGGGLALRVQRRRRRERRRSNVRATHLEER